MSSFIAQLKVKNPNLREAEIEGILYILLKTPGIKNNDLITKTGLPKETLKQFKSSIAAILLPSEKGTVSLTTAGQNLLEQLNLNPYRWNILELLDTTLVNRVSELRTVVNIMAKREYDQFFATPQTTLNKALILKERGLISGRNILLLGDDDLVSLTIPLVDSSYSKLSVYDIDSDLLSAIKKISSGTEIKNIILNKYDARIALKEHYQSELGRYDVVMTDPPYTPAGIFLFLTRAIEFLGTSKPGSDKYIFLFYGNSFKSPEKTLKIQEIIQDFNLLIEDKIDKFARYTGAESIGNASSLYILRLTPKTFIPKEVTDSNIYTYQTTKIDTFPYVDHITAKISGVNKNLLTSKKHLLRVCTEFCSIHKLKVVNTIDTHFKNQGLSISFILANSNLLIHTWPKLCALHLDLLTCTPIHNKGDLVKSLRLLFGTNLIEIRKIE